jgi:hypothetical protein
MKMKAIYAATVVAAAVLTACSDSAGRPSVTGPTALAGGGALRVEADGGLTPAAGTSDVPAAQTTTLTFDDITPRATAKIPNGYGGGLHWGRFGVVDPIAYGEGVGFGLANGYINGRVSGKYVAYIPGGGPTEITAPAGWTFDFISVYLTAANDQRVYVSGYTNGELRYPEQQINVNLTTPVLFTANYLGVDRVVFDSKGGRDGYSPLGDTFAMDNFTYIRNLPATK